MELNYNRLILLVNRYLMENSVRFLKVLIVLCGLIFIFSAGGQRSSLGIRYDSLVSWSYILMFIGGFLFTSSIFKEMHHPGRSYRFFTLPASNFEKLACAWIISSPLVVVGSFVLINVISWLVLALYVPLTEINYEFLDLVGDYNFTKMALYYMILQPIFLLGAAMFKRTQFVNTILWMLIVGFCLSVANIIIALIVLYPVHHFNFSGFNPDVPGLVEFIKNQFLPLIKVLFWYVMAPFFMVISYFRLKETEV